MIRCAGDQGHGKAAQDTAILLKLDAKDLAPPLAEKNRADALRYYQAAIKAGVPTAGLENAFARVPDELGVQKDEERARRYTIITNILEGYSYASPMVEELDEIVPLPPAPLPEWDGKLKWLEEWEKGTPPPLPEEERIREMAHSKGLDPATGRPLKLTPEPKAEAEVPPAPPPRLATGGPCPRTGYWRCVEDGKTLRFVEGQLMPPAVFYKPANGLLNRLRGIEREYSHNGPGHWDWVGEGNKG
ncbi:MAG: DUF6396 domain-containing protein [Azoarcus sp.]|nr:DUF6396 domain-containing protein [Azoarcus sp.]